MKKRFTACLSQEEDLYIAQCLEVDVASQGKTEKEALRNLAEALELHYEEPVATLAPQVRTIEIDVSAA